MLPEAIGSIDGQSVPFDEKVLVCDKFDPPNLRDWKTIRVDAGNPNPARNAGLTRRPVSGLCSSMPTT